MHPKNHHKGVDYNRAHMQQKYSIRKLCSIRFNCVLCLERTSSVQPMMADLPSELLDFENQMLVLTILDHFTSPPVAPLRKSGG